VQGTYIVQSVMGCGPLSTGSFVFIQFSVQTADRGFVPETVRMKGIGVFSLSNFRYLFHLMCIYCGCRYNVFVGAQNILILKITVGEYFV
jgi:hypothetical protein